MANRDLENNVSVALSLTPAARAASANGSAVDLQGYDSAVIAFIFGIATDGTHTPSVQHSTDASSWTTCDSNSLNGTLAAVTSSSGGSAVQKVGYTGGYRYVRAVLTVAGATTGALASAAVLRGHPAQGAV